MAAITVTYEASGILLSDAHREIQELLAAIRPATGEVFGLGDPAIQHEIALVAMGERADRVAQVAITFTNYDGLLASEDAARG